MLSTWCHTTSLKLRQGFPFNSAFLSQTFKTTGDRRPYIMPIVVSRTELQFTAIVFPEWITAHCYEPVRQ
jgi:hypothetical protein